MEFISTGIRLHQKIRAHKICYTKELLDEELKCIKR